MIPIRPDAPSPRPAAAGPVPPARRAPAVARAALGAALPVLALAAGCGHGDDAASENGAVVAVRTAAVTDSTVSRPIAATGTLGSREEVALAFKIGGVIARLPAEEGRRARAGETLAALAAAEIEARVATAEAALDKAERDLARARALAADSVIPREALDNAATAREVAANDVAIARFNRRHATIVAPADGVVLRRLAEPGQVVEGGAPVVVFGAEGKGRVVRVGLADRDVVRLAPGDPAEVRFDAYPGRAWRGRVARIGAAAAPGSGTYEVEIALDGPVAPAGGPAPSSGLIADVTLRPSRTHAVRLVPVIALLEGDGDRGFVWSLGPDGAPRRHDVRVAFLAGDRVAVASGLDGVERVVTDGAPYLTPSSRTRAADGPAADAAAPPAPGAGARGAR